MSSEKHAAKVLDAGPVPLDYLPGLKQNAKTDVVSGFILFLIALPLSLGIAIASGAPPIAGVIAGFHRRHSGLSVGRLLSSPLTARQPA